MTRLRAAAASARYTAAYLAVTAYTITLAIAYVTRETIRRRKAHP